MRNGFIIKCVEMKQNRNDDTRRRNEVYWWCSGMLIGPVILSNHSMMLKLRMSFSSFNITSSNEFHLNVSVIRQVLPRFKALCLLIRIAIWVRAACMKKKKPIYLYIPCCFFSTVGTPTSQLCNFELVLFELTDDFLRETNLV